MECGYAGEVVWEWSWPPDSINPRYREYARANASVGINGGWLTNVNANALILTPGYLAKVAALAGVLRPYGVRVYLTARFSAPIEIGGLPPPDPIDPRVRGWRAAPAAQISRAIPGFGGLPPKAHSQGHPAAHG